MKKIILFITCLLSCSYMAANAGNIQMERVNNGDEDDEPQSLIPIVNKNDSIIDVHLSEAAVLDIRVYNAFGQIVASNQTFDTGASIPVAPTSGIYTIKVDVDGDEYEGSFDVE